MFCESNIIKYYPVINYIQFFKDSIIIIITLFISCSVFYDEKMASAVSNPPSRPWASLILVPVTQVTQRKWWRAAHITH